MNSQILSKKLHNITCNIEFEKDSLFEYVDRGFDINRCLRTEKINNNEKQIINSINKQFITFKSKQAFYLLRGMRNPMHKRIINGILLDPAYISTTSDEIIAESFIKTDIKSETCCIIHLHFEANKEYKILPICCALKGTSFEYEKEILLPAGTKLEVISDPELLDKIKKEMGYTTINFIEEYTGEKPIEKPNHNIYTKNDVNYIIMKIADIQTGGTIHILGRKRKIIKRGRYSYIKYKNEFITLNNAKKIHNKLYK